MSVYYRYFKVLDAATTQAIESLVDQRNQYQQSIHEISKAVGASDTYFYDRAHGFAGFGFSETPDKTLWRKIKGGDIFYPKKSSKAGKALANRIEALSRPKSVHTALSTAGIETGPFGVLMDGLRCYSATVCGSQKKGWFAVIPWMDIDPRLLEEYRAERASGISGNGNYEHLLWTPPEEWVEVKKWEVERAIEGVEL
ncbi:hypothetical protein NCG89_00895 [Spongiibacter taiwanensis]|uniref:hypothetical protein n=1 Tax=Spongiibacter taiwanensis TaxID=1748242 RepID=UPI002035C679|nr:hypothetical protein [Spongiibacter taiwanensis]USA43360.1 hypothetical protein NCG89_00895 [Spongiibacter taiwanensis]